VPITPADRTGACVDSSPSARPSPLRWRVGIRDFTFEACSGYHSRYGPLGCSAARSDLCHEASVRPVTQPNRSSATRPIDYIWVDSASGFPRLFGAHSVIRGGVLPLSMPSPHFAEFIIGPAHRVRPLAGPMAGSDRTRWLHAGYGRSSLANDDAKKRSPGHPSRRSAL